MYLTKEIIAISKTRLLAADRLFRETSFLFKKLYEFVSAEFVSDTIVRRARLETRRPRRRSPGMSLGTIHQAPAECPVRLRSLIQCSGASARSPSGRWKGRSTAEAEAADAETLETRQS